MKNIFALFLILTTLLSCSDDKDCCVYPTTNVTLKFTHNWNGVEVTNQDFNQLKFTNKNGDKISIERLRYLISNISLIGFQNYQFIDVGENFGNLLTIQNVNKGNFNLKFRFGFSNNNNTDGAYADLNSASFNVPSMLGGGYHFMQFDGKYLDSNNETAGFNYHTIRAVDRTDPDNLILEDTSFMVDLGDVAILNNTTIEIKMNIAEWFKNPNTWNLNELNTVLMPNFNAQKMMSANGKTVFSLGEVSQ